MHSTIALAMRLCSVDRKTSCVRWASLPCSFEQIVWRPEGWRPVTQCAARRDLLPAVLLSDERQGSLHDSPPVLHKRGNAHSFPQILRPNLCAVFAPIGHDADLSAAAACADEAAALGDRGEGRLTDGSRMQAKGRALVTRNLSAPMDFSLADGRRRQWRVSADQQRTHKSIRLGRGEPSAAARKVISRA
jgi:hypothetical protein